LAKRWHPDKNRGNVELATRKMQLLEKAKETLMDKEKRKAYDLTRAQSA
jgi:DnaJ-class molecular chaperone